MFKCITYDDFRTPTIKHGCPRTRLSAANRARSNVVQADPEMWKDFENWVLSTKLPEILSWLEEEIVQVRIDDWLQKFPQRYQEKMREALKYDNKAFMLDVDFVYEAFPKIEQQFTTVPHELKDTPLNDVKERQICGPLDQVKVIVNAFFNAMEGVMHRHNPYYCGRANWEDICNKIKKAGEDLDIDIIHEGDGSGFDNTQKAPQHAMMAKIYEAILNHRNVVLEDPLHKEEIMHVLHSYQNCRVSVDHGKVKYYADSRESGQGDTTLSNTLLVTFYYEYTYHLAGIKKFFLLGKGDDTLNGHPSHQNDAFMNAWSRVFTTGKHAHTHGLGQICKGFVTGDLSKLSFISNRFFRRANGEWRMSRMGDRLVETIWPTCKIPPYLSPKQKQVLREELCFSKGSCLLAWAKGLPIWDKLARKMMALGRKGAHTDYCMYSDGGRLWTDDSCDDWEPYLLFLEMNYSITLADVRAIEKAIDSIDSLVGEIYIPEFAKFFQ